MTVTACADGLVRMPVGPARRVFGRMCVNSEPEVLPVVQHVAQQEHLAAVFMGSVVGQNALACKDAMHRPDLPRLPCGICWVVGLVYSPSLAVRTMKLHRPNRLDSCRCPNSRLNRRLLQMMTD